MRLFRSIKTFKNWDLHYWDRHRTNRIEDHLELRLRNGLALRVRSKTSDFRTSRSIFRDESYVPAPIEIREDATVLDIGGHIGCFTLFVAHRAPKGRVFTYEPEPVNFEMLRENVRINDFSHVTVHNLAVSADKGERKMVQPDKKGSTGGNSFFARGNRSFTATCTTLPLIFEENNLDQVDFLKLDCEGAEIEILETLPDEIFSRIRQMVMEIHYPDRMRPIFERIQDLGFKRVVHPKKNYGAFHRP